MDAVCQYKLNRYDARAMWQKDGIVPVLVICDAAADDDDTVVLLQHQYMAWTFHLYTEYDEMVCLSSIALIICTAV